MVRPDPTSHSSPTDWAPSLLWATCALFALLGAVPADAVPTGDPPSPYGCWLEKELSTLYEQVSPAVVSVVSWRVRTRGAGTSNSSMCYRRLVASGVVVADHGCVVTTARVAQPGDSIVVHFPSGKWSHARYKGTDPATHVAVLNLVSDGPFPYLAMPGSEPGELPEWVAAVAYGPWVGSRPGQPSLALSQKSAIQQSRTHYGDSIGIVWRIRAPFSPGNSGGALVSLSGQWVGLITGAVAEQPSRRTTASGLPTSQAASPDIGVIVPSEVVARAIRTSDRDVMVVGHLPFVANLASKLLAGDASAVDVHFPAAGVLCLEHDRQDGWRVAWMVTPALINPSPG